MDEVMQAIREIKAELEKDGKEIVECVHLTRPSWTRLLVLTSGWPHEQHEWICEGFKGYYSSYSLHGVLLGSDLYE